MISSSSVLTSDAVGFSYNDECFSYTMTYGQSRNRTTLETSREHRLQCLVPHDRRFRLEFQRFLSNSRLAAGHRFAA